MKLFTKQFSGITLFLSLLFIMSACAPPTYRTHPEFEMRAKSIKNPGVIPPDVKIYEVSAGEVREMRLDWCDIGKEHMNKAVIESLKDKGFNTKTIPFDKDLVPELEEILALYRAVSFSIDYHTYGPILFPEKQKNFDYSIGPVEKILDKFAADSLIFVSGYDEISTTGRKALTAIFMVLGAASGQSGQTMARRSGLTIVSIAVVDKSGSIIWYNRKGSLGQYDLREANSVTNFVYSTIADLPRSEK